MSPTPCVPCCSTPQSVAVPGIEGEQGLPGVDGTNGENGADGLNSFTTLSDDLTVPAVGANTTMTVTNTQWMVVGEVIVAEGPASFQVISVDSTTTATVKFLGYTLDVAPTTVIATGASVGPSGMQPIIGSLSVYAAGTPYTLTEDATPQQMVFGTTNPSLPITSAGTWLIFARVRYDYVDVNNNLAKTITTQLYDTTAAAQVASSQWIGPYPITGRYGTVVFHVIQPTIYVTADALSVVELRGAFDATLGNGTIDAVEAEIVAIRLA